MTFAHQPIDLAALLSRPPQPPAWVIDNVAEEGAVTYIHSAPGIGKSLVAMDMCLSVALGRSFAGRAAVSGHAVYLDNEMPLREIERRVRSLGVTPSNASRLSYYSQVGPLLDGSVSAFIEALRPRQPKLIVIDSFRAMFSGDESSDQHTMLPFIRIREIAQKLNAAVIVLGHDRRVGADGKADFRGSGNIKAQSDTMYQLTASSTGVLLLDSTDSENGKNRSGLALGRLAIRLVREADGSTRLAPHAPTAPPSLADDIVAILDRPMTSNEIAAGVARGKQSVTRELGRLVEGGRLTAQMEGQRKLYAPGAVLAGATP